MATDRLAALRAQQGGSYASNNSAGRFGQGDGGYQSRRPNPYAQQDDSGNRYEMNEYSSNAPRTNGYGGGGRNGYPPAQNDLTAFYDEVGSVRELIQRYEANIDTIANLHQRSLNNIDDRRAENELESLRAETREMSMQLRDRIKSLQSQGGDTREGQMKRQQAAILKEQFQKSIQKYQRVEQKTRQDQKMQMERQYKIVKPNASADEVQAVVNDEGSGQIFQQALMNSDRFGQARQAYREVQSRHNEILKIAQTMNELQQLMNDMAIIVEEQGETINQIEQTAEAVDKDVETGYKHTEAAKESAMSARKKRWICFIIVVIILIIVAIVIAINVVKGNIGGGGNNNNNNNNQNTVTVTAAAPVSTAARLMVRMM